MVKKEFIITVLLTLFSSLFHHTDSFGGEASTKFNIYVPPNNNNANRDVSLVVTALNNKTTIDIVDDNDDGDSDDSYSGTLNRGESYVLFIADNAVNDDAGGKWDGDHFIITASNPVIVLQATTSDWQHDWVPANNGKMTGNNYYLYSPPSSFSNRDLNIFAYRDNTSITIKDITVIEALSTGKTLVTQKNAEIIAQFDLDVGQDIINTFQHGRDVLVPGHTYLIQANHEVSVQYGALYRNVFDGGGWVPGAGGTKSDKLFYFAVPGQSYGTQQIKVISQDNNNSVTLDFYQDDSWLSLDSWSLDKAEEAEWQAEGDQVFAGVFRVQGSKNVSLFEDNKQALQDSSSNDVTSSIASEEGEYAGLSFLCLLSEPSSQDKCVNPFTGSLYETKKNTHLFFSTDHDGTEITVKDVRTDGAVFSRTYNLDRDHYADCLVNENEYDQIAGTKATRQAYLKVESSKPISVLGSNWNDNWTSFMGGTLEPKLESRTSADRSEIFSGETVSIQSIVKNIADQAMSNTRTEVKIPDGLDFVDAIMRNSQNGEIGRGTRQGNEDGSESVIWNNFPLNAVDSVAISMTCTANSDHLPDREVIPVITSSLADLDGRRLGRQSSRGFRVNSASGGIYTTSIIVAFEDLKGSSWNDWDYNDFVVKIDIKTFLNRSRDIGRLIITYEPLARGAAQDHALHHRISFSGSANATLSYIDRENNVISSSESQYRDGADIQIYESTRGSLPPLSGFTTTNTLANQPGKVLGQLAQLVLEFADPAANPNSDFQKAPFDPYLLTDIEQTIHVLELAGTSVGNTQNLDNVAEDNELFGYPLGLAIYFKSGWKWPLEQREIWLAYPQFPNFIKSGGKKVTNWHLEPNPEFVWQDPDSSAALQAMQSSVLQQPVITRRSGQALKAEKYQSGFPMALEEKVFASPLLYDFDGDGAMEVVIAAMDGKVHLLNGLGVPLAGWPIATGGITRSSPTVGDLNGDGQFEIVVGNETGKIFAWQLDGTEVTGWPVNLQAPIKSSIVISDLENDGTPEIVVSAGDGKVYVLDSEGRAKSGWPQDTGGNIDTFGQMLITSSPGVYDLNGDDNKEVFVGSTDGKIYMWNAAGQLMNGFPFQTDDWIYASPAVGQFDNEADLEVVFVSGAGTVYLLKADATVVPDFPLKLDTRVVASPALGDVDEDGQLEIVIGGLDNKVYAINHDGSIMQNWPATTYGAVFSSAAIVDIDDDGAMEIVAGANDGVIYVWKADGNSDEKYIRWMGETSGWIVASPSIGDVDGDKDMDVVVGTYDEKVYTIDLATPFREDLVQWGMFRGSPDRSGVSAASLTSNAGGTAGFNVDRVFAYPNPLVDQQTVTFRIEFETLPEDLSLRIFDVGGELVKSVKQNEMDLLNTAYEFVWDITNDQGLNVANGVYLYQFESSRTGKTIIKVGKVAIIL